MSSPKKYNSETGGVEAFPIEGRFYEERERCKGTMTDEDRRWRAQFLKDQELSPREPVMLPEIYLELVNPIRRAARWPLDFLWDKLNFDKYLGRERANLSRLQTGRILWLISLSYIGTYYFMYHNREWTTNTGWYMTMKREGVYPGHPEYPKISDKNKGADYCDRGFKNSPI